jgi:hypothetical protein
MHPKSHVGFYAKYKLFLFDIYEPYIQKLQLNSPVSLILSDIKETCIHNRY